MVETPHPPLTISSSTHSHANGVSSPRNDFILSQRATDYGELSRLDSLSLEEQEIMANIQDLQLQLMQLRAEEEEESEDESSSTTPNVTTTATPGNQLIVVSNNLPILLERIPQTGRWKVTKTTGGLDKLMCLTGVRNDLNFLWVGWVGQHIPKNEHESVRRLLLQHNCLPVFISSEVATRHNGFSSDVLWSLFHYVSEPIALSAVPSTKRFNKQDWRAYESANESFADAIAEIYNEGDSVWVHDYHLMLLPSLLRSRIPLCRIGWFLHTPFPASDVYCRLPVRSELLRGVLQSDLIGFQTFDYERHFVSTCQRVLGVETSHKGIRTMREQEHFTSTGVFPIGISIEPLARAASSASTLHRVNELHKRFGTKRIILGVDRLDHIKGIPHKLLAMEMLLKHFPEWQHNVVLIQIGLSSRSGVVDSNNTTTTNSSGSKATPGQRGRGVSGHAAGSMELDALAEGATIGSSVLSPTASKSTPTSPPKESNVSTKTYDANHPLEMSSQSNHLLSQVNQMVGRINGIYGTLDYSPIHFIQHRVLQHEELCALYDLADVCLVTSTRDGMNLVSHEFIVCQQHFMRRKEGWKRVKELSPTSSNPSKILPEWEGEEGGPGVLILSEFAGSSQSLSGAMVINPWNTEDVAASIHQALSMCRTERELRQQKLYRHVSSNTATAWSIQFLSELEDAVLQNKQNSTSLPKLEVKSIVSAYQQAKNRVIILDYDRTLTPQHALLPLAAVGPNFKSVLDALSMDPHNTVFIVSARERKFLETWLSGVRVGVAAEDGFFYRMDLSNEGEEWKTMSKFQYDSATMMRHTSTDRRTSIINHEDDVDSSWKNLVLPTMLRFTDRTPGSYIEDKESLLTWHYDDADPQFGGWQAKDLQISLERQLIGTALDVYHGHLYVSVEHEGCTKAKVLEGILKYLSLPQQIYKQGHEVDFVLCVCDDTTDDQMFQTLHTLLVESNERHEKEKQLNKRLSVPTFRTTIPPVPLERSKSSSARMQTRRKSSNPSSRQKSEKGTLRRASSASQGRTKASSLELSRLMEDDEDTGEMEEEDTKVTFSRLSKVPVRMANNVSIFTVVVGPDVQHSAGRHKSAYAVDNLTDVRQILKEFVDASRKTTQSTTKPMSLPETEEHDEDVVEKNEK